MVEWTKRNWFYLFITALFLFAFDHMMRKDAERMCRSDATAYAECTYD